VKADRDGYFTDTIRTWPELAAVIGDGQRAGPIRVITKWHGYFRQSAGPGWVLVGDAGHFKDPTPGFGISDALRQTQQLAEHVVDGFGSGHIDAATQRWWAWRDQDAYEFYWFAQMLGEPGGFTPLKSEVIRGISKSRKATRRFFQVLDHTARPSQLFTSTLLAGAVARTLWENPRDSASTIKEVAAEVASSIRQTRQRRRVPPVASQEVFLRDWKPSNAQGWSVPGVR
jgi:hypothetical protein